MDPSRPSVRPLAPLGRLLEFSGRTRRAEFWPYMLLLAGLYLLGFAGVFAIGYRGGLFGSMTIMFLWTGLLSLLAFAAAVRRMHDVGWSGWWVAAYVMLCWGFIAHAIYSRARVLAGVPALTQDYFPVIAVLGLLMNGLGLLLLVVCALDGAAGPNRFGPDPKNRPAPDPQQAR